MIQYLREHGLEVEGIKTQECYQISRFGPSRQYTSNIIVEIPMIVKRMDRKQDVLNVFTYLVDAYVPFLCGKREMVERWKSKIDTKNKVLETEINGKRKDFRIIETGGNHVVIEIEKKKFKGRRNIFLHKEKRNN